MSYLNKIVNITNFTIILLVLVNKKLNLKLCDYEGFKGYIFLYLQFLVFMYLEKYFKFVNYESIFNFVLIVRYETIMICSKLQSKLIKKKNYVMIY